MPLRFLGPFCVSLSLWAPTSAQDTAAQDTAVAVASNRPQAGTDFTRTSLAAFDQVWSTVVDRAWNASFDRDRWEEAKRELRPKVASVSDATEVREILEQLLSRLHLSHYSIIPGEVYGEFEGSVEEGAPEWESGISTRVIDGKAYVIEVVPHCDAYAQGMRAGWQLATIRGKSTQAFIAGLAESLDKGSAYRPETLASLMIGARLAGPAGASVGLSCIDTNGSAVDLEIKLHEPRGEKVNFGYLPTMYVQSESSEVAPGIGYLRFNTFFAPDKVMNSLDEAIAVAEHGLIIDLRGNHGGLAGMTMGIGNRVIAEEKRRLGVQIMKAGEVKYVLTPGAHPYTGPVAVLIDECSISSAEILAGGLQAIARARIFGATSAGAALPSMVTKLPNGDFFQFAIADFVDANGRRIEGTGVVPDTPAPLTVSDLTKGSDPALEAAMAWLLPVNKQ